MTSKTEVKTETTEPKEAKYAYFIKDTAQLKRKWLGPIPQKCDISNEPIVHSFVDGRTKMGPWANMTEESHKEHGFGLGTGNGQMYVKGEFICPEKGEKPEGFDDIWWKVDG